MAEIAAIMLIEEITGAHAHLPFPPPIVPNAGDRLQCGATVYLDQNVMKALSRSVQIVVDGIVTERTFIHRGQGDWVVHVRMARGSFQAARAVEPGHPGCERGE